MTKYAELRAALANGTFDFDQRAYMRDVHALLAERDALRKAIEGLLNALPSATTHPAIQAARAALAQGEV